MHILSYLFYTVEEKITIGNSSPDRQNIVNNFVTIVQIHKKIPPETGGKVFYYNLYLTSTN